MKIEQQSKIMHVTEETIRIKKVIFDEINKVLIQLRKKLEDFFQRVDVDGSNTIELPEFEYAFREMQLDIPQHQVEQIFHSMDFDGDERITMPEFRKDFGHFVRTEVGVLLAEQREKERAAMIRQQEKAAPDV